MIRIPKIVQGGMGTGVSLKELAAAVAIEGGVGTISSACIDYFVSQELGEKLDTRSAMKHEVQEAKKASQGKGQIWVNIMAALDRDYDESVIGAIEGGADVIVSGGGLPRRLPFIAKERLPLVPIVSSIRALNILIKRHWKGRMPDAIVVEGPKAGGHLGFKYIDIQKQEHQLENIFPAVKEFADKNGDIPVIVAGGLVPEDMPFWLNERGADAVQFGTLFAATDESGANKKFKAAITSCKKDDIIVVDPKHEPPGSPCGLPFRIIKDSPMYLDTSANAPVCDKGYVLRKESVSGKYMICAAKDEPERNFCICNGLINAGFDDNKQQLWTVGEKAYLLNEIVSVRTRMDEINRYL